MICARDQLTLSCRNSSTRNAELHWYEVCGHASGDVRDSPTHFLLLFLFLIGTVFPATANPIIIGSKKFTESYVLGEIARRALNDAGVAAEHRQGMGGTIILWQGLRGGQIDAYPEYTGTIGQEILKNGHQQSFQEIRDALENSALA